MNPGKLALSVEKHEKLRQRAYQDSRGIWTIGYGRNLQTMEIPILLADAWLKEDLDTATEAAKRFPEFAFLDTDARQNAFIEMVYNLGEGKLSYFKLMLAAIRAQDWKEVAKQALDSAWATQVGQRALTLIAMLQTGNFPD